MEPDSECESCGWVFENGGDPPHVFTVNYGPRAGESITRCSMCLNTQNALGRGAQDVERTVLYCANAILAQLAARDAEIERLRAERDELRELVVWAVENHARTMSRIDGSIPFYWRNGWDGESTQTDGTPASIIEALQRAKEGRGDGR